jgi:hypothetical protein
MMGANSNLRISKKWSVLRARAREQSVTDRRAGLPEQALF